MRRVLPFLLALAAIGVYAGTLQDPFIFDDPMVVVRNASIRHAGTALQPDAFAAGAAGRPVFNATLAANYAAGGVAPEGYHAVNIALHALCALLLMGVVRRVVAEDGDWIGFVAALAWAVHPLVTAAVNPINQRSELLATLFILLALWSFARGWLALTLGACLLGMGSKEVAWAIPVMVLLFDVTFHGGSIRKRSGFYAALFACWAALAALILTTRHRAGTVGFGLGASAWNYLLTQCRALGIYAERSVWPHPLVNDYGTTLVRSLADVLPQAIAIVAALGFTIWGLMRRSAVAWAGAACFLVLAPSSSFIPIVTEPYGEQRVYLPLAAIISVAVALTWRWGGRRALASWSLPIAVGAGLTVARNRDYRSEETLLRQDLAANPANDRAWLSLGTLAARRGDWTGAARDYREALRIGPDAADAHFNLGIALEHGADRAGAAAELTRAVALRPNYPVALRELALQLAQDHRFEEAAAALEQAYALQPGSARLQGELATIHFDQGVVAAEAGDFAAARVHFARTLELRPADEQARRNLERIAGLLGR